ncbi:hypothetical protein [Cytobacillus purgationiresistens]|uniref:hypothetical protein n=1 Tax=Cytobacillus purgationiresistens TaxID=863449 RepID=UPI0027D89EB7|nr:hypothetical protein [Cytobacillus purgationiresistens]
MIIDLKTQSALKSNIEWNVEIVAKEYGPFIQDVLKAYNHPLIALDQLFYSYSKV